MKPKQEEALRDYLRESIVPLIEDVLTKKLGQAITFVKEELAAPVQEPVKFLANGTRFKTSESPYGVCINGLPKELSGRWIALVAAEDNCHLKLTTPPAAQRTWVGLTDEELDYLCELAYEGDEELILTVQAKLKEKNNG